MAQSLHSAYDEIRNGHDKDPENIERVRKIFAQKKISDSHMGIVKSLVMQSAIASIPEEDRLKFVANSVLSDKDVTLLAREYHTGIIQNLLEGSLE